MHELLIELLLIALVAATLYLAIGVGIAAFIHGGDHEDPWRHIVFTVVIWLPAIVSGILRDAAEDRDIREGRRPPPSIG